MNDPCCGTCKWHKPDGHAKHPVVGGKDWVCANRDSDAYGCYTAYSDGCRDYEERE